MCHPFYTCAIFFLWRIQMFLRRSWEGEQHVTKKTQFFFFLQMIDIWGHNFLFTWLNPFHVSCPDQFNQTRKPKRSASGWLIIFLLVPTRSYGDPNIRCYPLIHDVYLNMKISPVQIEFDFGAKIVIIIVVPFWSIDSI